MAREYKKGVYTLAEISEQAMKRWPGRWANTESAYASVKTAARGVNIGDINGKRKYKQIAAVDVLRIMEELEKTNRRKKSGPKQGDFFSLLPSDEIVTAGPVEVLTIDTKPAEAFKNTAKSQKKTAETFDALTLAAQNLGRAFLDFALALKAYKGEV